MKKILFLSPLPPPEYGAAIMSNLCLEVIRSSKKFKVINIKLNYSKEMRDIGKFNFSKLKGFLKVNKKVSSSIKNFRPDFVYFAPATRGLGMIRDFLFIKKIKRKKISLVFHIHSRLFHNPWNNFFYKRMFKGEKAIILGKELLCDINNFVKNEDVFILPNAIKNIIDEKEFKEIIKNREKNNEFNVLFLSNMDRDKGWYKLLEACKILKNKKIHFKCNFVGSWKSKKDEKDFNFFIKENNMKNVYYVGKKISSERDNFYKLSNVLVFPTEYKLETFGLVIIEAMMFGLPIIANGVATIPSIISNEKSGFILKENSPEEISNNLIKLIDKKRQFELGYKSREIFLDKFELKKYETKFIKLLNSIH